MEFKYVSVLEVLRGLAETKWLPHLMQSIISYIKATLGPEAQIEDLWLSYFCISTNITHSQMMVHRYVALRHSHWCC